MRETFRRLMYTVPGEWKRADLTTLSLAELRGLCELLGVPVSGTKAECVERLISLGGLRQLLADYDDPARLVADFDKRELKGMAAMAQIWKSGSKLQLAVGLIQWRNACRYKGQLALDKARAQLRTQPKQLTLAFTQAA